MSATPLLGDLSLEYVHRIEHALDGGFVGTRIAGLPGEVQQRAARGSHQIFLCGVLFGEEARDELDTLQRAAAVGEELTFVADITTALELEKVVITGFKVREEAGTPDRFAYELWLSESPPLPPPADLDPFGGLGDFGVGDLGFDTDILGDIEGLAGEVASAIDAAQEALDALSALANLDGLSLGGFLQPMNDRVASVSALGGDFAETARLLDEGFGS